MRSPAVFASALVHAGILASLVLIAHQTEKHQALQVVVVDKPKVEKPKPPPPPPPPPPARPPPKPAAAEPPAPTPTGEHAAPVALSGLELSNDNGPGIALGGPVAPQPAVPESRLHAPKGLAKQNMKSALEECNEEPTKPEPIFKQEIEYSAQARADGIEGRLVLRLHIGADGSVIQVEVLSSVEAALDAAAIASAKKWRFKPAMRCGKPMAGGVYTLARRFELGD
jgi:protein TonB